MAAQFRILFRAFLFRMIDLELLSSSAQGDVSKLLGQFAALLVSFSLALSFVAIVFAGAQLPRLAALFVNWSAQHFLIATTMLVVGLFAVLSWDSTFPNRRDVLVLAPLPIRSRTIFLAKVAAVAASLGLTVLSLHLLAGIAWPFAFHEQIPEGPRGFLGLVRTFCSYWVTMFAAGAFIYCSVLALQGVTAQLLPRRWFLRVSSFLQLAVFCLLVGGYFLEPFAVGPATLVEAQSGGLLSWSPSLWFLGLFEQLNRSAALDALARRALAGLAVAASLAIATYVLSYFRTMRKIAEEPDILPGARTKRWLPQFEGGPQAAVVRFSVRTLLRSRQHRMILAFFWGIALAAVILLTKAPAIRQLLSEDGPGDVVTVPLLAASIVTMCYAVIGMRVVFSMPLDLRANWIFRLLGDRAVGAATVRRSLWSLSVAPVWLLWAAYFLVAWPWPQAAAHLTVLALLGTILAELCLLGFRKLPFTCSYRPGKSYVHMVVIANLLGLQLLAKAASFEKGALQDPALYAAMAGTLAAVALGAHWLVSQGAASPEERLQFEDLEDPAVLQLGLSRN